MPVGAPYLGVLQQDGRVSQRLPVNGLQLRATEDRVDAGLGVQQVNTRVAL